MSRLLSFLDKYKKASDVKKHLTKLIAFACKFVEFHFRLQKLKFVYTFCFDYN